MSHFCVLVIGPDVDKQLQPYHEYECTGTDDEYVYDVDVTDRVMSEWAEEVEAVRMPDGKLYGRYDRRFYFETGEVDRIGLMPHKKTEFRLPEGAEEVKTTRGALAEAEGQTLAKWAEDWGNWKQWPDGRFYIHTNPNAHWDWWQVGGRWTGFFKVRPGAMCIAGKAGLMTTPAERGYGDVCQKGDVDIAGMRDEKEAAALEEWDKAHAVIRGRSWRSWDECRASSEDTEEARTAYWSQPVASDWRADRDLGWLTLDDFRVAREEYGLRARAKAGVPFAVVKDGQWYQRGRMGWWGSVSDEKDDETWCREYSRLIDGLPDDTLYTVVDCHI